MLGGVLHQHADRLPEPRRGGAGQRTGWGVEHQIPALLGRALGTAVRTGAALAAVRQRDDGRVRLTLARDVP